MAVRERALQIGVTNAQVSSSSSRVYEAGISVDLGYPMIDPITNDANLSVDLDAVRNSVRNIIFTKIGSRPFQPTFGSLIPELLFESLSPDIVYNIGYEIENSVKKWEPRISDIQTYIDYNEDHGNELQVTLIYQVGSNEVIDDISLTLTRQR